MVSHAHQIPRSKRMLSDAYETPRSGGMLSVSFPIPGFNALQNTSSMQSASRRWRGEQDINHGVGPAVKFEAFEIETGQSMGTARSHASFWDWLQRWRRVICVALTLICVILTLVSLLLKSRFSSAETAVSNQLAEIGMIAFKEYDEGNKGWLILSELKEVLKALGQKFSAKQVKSFMWHYGRRGRMIFPEFLHLLVSEAKLELEPHAINKTFALLATAGNSSARYICALDLYHAVIDMGGRTSKEEMQDLIEQVGTKVPGKLDLAEYEDLVKGIESMHSDAAHRMQKVISALTMVVYYSKGCQIGGFVFVDAGSSLSKLYSVTEYGEESQIKVRTICTGKCPDPDGVWLRKGIAAVSYDQPTCRSNSSADWDEKRWGFRLPRKRLYKLITTNDCRPLYSTYLLDILWTMRERSQTCQSGGRKNICQHPHNKQEIPILATAGMRLLTRTNIDEIWAAVCGAQISKSDYKFATKGEYCGTISGTKEAYYEWLANIAIGESKRWTGTFTLGGVSAQIAIPLLADAEVKSFRSFMHSIGTKVGDCKRITTAIREFRPSVKDLVFQEANRENDPRACYKDFVNVIEKKDIRLPLYHFVTAGLFKLKGVALISFLGFGVDAIEDWAKQHQCGSSKTAPDPSFDFKRCRGLLLDYLENDWLWVPFRQWFRRTRLTVSKFSYNTPAAIPSWQFLAKIPSEKPVHDILRKDELAAPDARATAGYRLAARVQERCTDKKYGNLRFGFDNTKTCMGTFFTALYITSFFDGGSEETSSELDAVLHKLSRGPVEGPGKKKYHELFFHKETDWSAGVYLELLAGSKRRSQEIQKSSIAKEDLSRRDHLG